MTLVRWRPYRDMLNMHRRFNHMVGRGFMNHFEDEQEEVAQASWHPVTDIYESKDEYGFKVELPGLSKEDVQIEFEKDELRISGERKREEEVKGDDYHRFERSFGTFSRTFSLPKDVDDKKISASMKDGILDLRLPKREEVKPKSIPIKIN